MTENDGWNPHWESDDVEIDSTKVIYQGHFELVTHQLRFKQFSGQWSPWILREQVQIYNSVAVLLYDPKKDCVVLVEQFRVGVMSQTEHSPWLLEIVAGFADVENESLEQAVMRESKEEANVEIKSLMPVYEYYPSPGGLSEKISIFCGIVDSEGVGGVHGLAEEGEDIKVHTLSYLEVERLIENGMLTSSSTLIAHLWLKLNRAHLQSLSYV